MKTLTLFKFLRPTFKGLKRWYALPKAEYGCTEVIRTSALNGMKIAAGMCSGVPLPSITVMFQVGSRHEIDDQIGVTHFIRVGSFTRSAEHTAYMKCRLLQQRGATITCRSDRQTIAFTFKCPYDHFTELCSYFADGAVKCLYPEYELDEVRTIIKDDLLMRTKEQMVLDLVQKACFAGPLSNSVYCLRERMSTINSEVINNYITNNFKTTVCSIGSWGVPYDDVLKVAAIIDCGKVEMPGPQYCLSPSFPRGGYEVYDTGNKGSTYIALAVPGFGTCNYTDCLKVAILAAACGTGPVTRSKLRFYDQTPGMPLSYICEDILPTEVKAFNISYLETGCFGLIIKTRSEHAKCIAYRCSNFIANLGMISDEEIQAGKNRLKLGVMLNYDSPVKASEDLALQAACKITINDAQAFCAAIDRITTSSVVETGCCLATRRSSGQMAVAVVGDVAAVPDQRELLCGEFV